MAQQINEITQESSLYKLEKDALKQADSAYLYNHFRLGDKEDAHKTKFIMLLIDTLSNKNCEVSKFFDKKLRGALDNTNIEIADLKTVQTKYRDINNYYVGQPFLWSATDW